MKDVLFFYLHGFNSGFDPNQQKVRQLQELAPVFGRTTNYLSSTDRKRLNGAIADIVDYNKAEVILVGTSLGGYFARYFARHFDLRCILINPSLDPMTTLRDQIGPQRNFVTGDEYLVTERDVYDLDKYSVTKTRAGCLAIVAQDDERLDPKKTEVRLSTMDCEIVRTMGGHRMNDLSPVLPAIKHFIYQVPMANENI